MKRILMVVLGIMLISSLFLASCQKQETTPAGESGEEKPAETGESGEEKPAEAGGN